jgi:hypothetical protein
MTARTSPIRSGKFEVVHPQFFFMPLRSLTVESDPNTGRTYFIDKNGKIVAVAWRKKDGA